MLYVVISTVRSGENALASFIRREVQVRVSICLCDVSLLEVLVTAVFDVVEFTSR